MVRFKFKIQSSPVFLFALKLSNESSACIQNELKSLPLPKQFAKKRNILHKGSKPYCIDAFGYFSNSMSKLCNRVENHEPNVVREKQKRVAGNSDTSIVFSVFFKNKRKISNTVR